MIKLTKTASGLWYSTDLEHLDVEDLLGLLDSLPEDSSIAILDPGEEAPEDDEDEAPKEALPPRT